VTDEALALAFRSGLPFVGLRDHAPDPDLDRIVPPDAACTARALPLAAEADHIRLAVADPDADLSALDPFLTGRQVDLALAPREELDAILGPPPPVADLEQPAGEAPEQVPDEDEPELPATAGTEAEPGAAPSDDEREHVGAPDGGEAEALAAAPSDEDESEPAAPPSAEDALERVGEPDRGALWVAGASDVGVARETDVAAVGGEVGAAGAGDAATASVVAEPDAPVDDHPELAGELPSWLDPPRRGRRVLLTVLIVIVVLAVAAAVVIAFVNA
jgi:Type II secretion system (T2SS), protein E, N-terminal domain